MKFTCSLLGESYEMSNVVRHAKQIRLTFLITLLCVTGCQTPFSEIEGPAPEEIIDPGSALASLLLNVAMLDGSDDNLLDSASCATIQLPITVIVGEQEIIIETLDDIELIFEAFEQQEEDDFDIVFPYHCRTC